MSRLDEKNDLLLKLGKLFGPLERLAEYPNDYDAQERTEIVARYISEHLLLIQSFGQFKVGQAGHDYNLEYKKFLRALADVPRRIERDEPLQEIVEQQRRAARDAITAVPVPRASAIFEAGSPFTAYCRIRSLCEADVMASITWFDRYISQDVFHRYLQHVGRQENVTIVTCEPPPRAKKREIDRWNTFLDISRLFASERGYDKYRLLVAPSIHDRWLILDNSRIYHLGGSAKDAASKDIFTISVVDASPTNLQIINDAVNTSTEWFGALTPTHR